MAASIGQVYRVRLRDGRDVAVRVQYPGIEAAVRADLENLRLFAKFRRSVAHLVGLRTVACGTTRDTVPDG